GAEVGFLFLTVTAVALPVTLMMAFRWWPKTPMGRRILLDVPKSEEVLPDSPERRWLRQMVGRVGVAKSLMLPSGAIEVDGHTIDALTEGTSIEAGQRVRVIAVSGNRVLVRVADDQTPAETDDVLSRPIDSLGLESLDDPLG
ncbi:MAG TPA: NfeD family protein, partial [Pirellulales bacterium]